MVRFCSTRSRWISCHCKNINHWVGNVIMDIILGYVFHACLFQLIVFLDHCLVPKKVGPCRGSFPRWHYSALSEQCEKFVFGGCNPNRNNYLSEEECKKACDQVSGSTVYICQIIVKMVNLNMNNVNVFEDGDRFTFQVSFSKICQG